MNTSYTYGHDDGPDRGSEFVVREPYAAWDLTTAARRVSSGLPAGVLESLRAELGLTLQELSELVAIPMRTLARRRKEKSLTAEESERAWRVGRIIDIAIEILGSREQAREWLREPNMALGGAAPLTYMGTEPGARLVERVLFQLGHGITV
jgi:putative toxin-antitoxin system antitoxin component (TIGR02293 family)